MSSSSTTLTAEWRTFDPSALGGNARYLSGRLKPMYMMQGLDESFDAVFFISYHGSMSSSSAALSHTYFPAAFAEVTLNGRVTGEAGINAVVAKAHDVPIVLVTGDSVTAAEIRSVCPGIKEAIVKESITRFAAESLHPDAACRLIREEARRAIQDSHNARPPQIETPATLAMRFHNADYAELASRINGIARTGDTTASIRSADALELFTSFITVVLLCRGFVE